MSRWWRAYDEAVDDPKLILLSDKQHRAWFNLCCITSQNGGALPALAVIAVKLRVSVEKARTIVAELVALGLVDNTEGVFAPHNWKGRQFLSDNSAERVKRHRAKREAAGLKSQWTAPKKLRIAVYTRDNFQCVYCGSEENLSLDHRTPEIRGGTHDIENLQTACMSCNGAKRDMTHDEYVTRNENVTLLKRPQTTEAENRGSEAYASAADAAPADEDPKAKLFRVGKTTLVSFGIAEKRTGSLIGQWLKTRNDPAGLLAAIEYARDQNVAEPVAYITTLVNTAEKPNGRHGKQDLSAMAFAIADELRQRECPGGDGRSDELRGSG